MWRRLKASAAALIPQPGGFLRKLALLLLPEFSNFGLAAVTEPLFIANWLAQDTVFEWRTICDDGKPVRASNGSIVPVDGDLALAAGCASVFVLASFDPARTARSRALVRWLKRIARSGVEFVGIENGSLALAEAGLLDHHSAAIHWDNLAGFQELFPKIRIAQALISFSNNRVTCAGAAAILDMMITWIGQHADVQTASEVARHLLLYSRRGPSAQGAPARGTLAHGMSAYGGLTYRATDRWLPDGAAGGQFASDSDAVVARARALMQANVDDPLSCGALAQQLGLSLRQLERRFKQQLGQTLHSEYMLVRVEKAHQYLQQTGLTVTEVAALTGFSSVEYFSKVYRRVFGVLPSTDRRQSTDAPVFRMKAAKRKAS
jgi:AraC family transcriptional regulator, carnitine catabolism transcriptional activator